MKLVLGMGASFIQNTFDIQTYDLSIHVVDALPTVHVLSICDSTQLFFLYSVIGKPKFFKIVCKVKGITMQPQYLKKVTP